MKATIDGAGRLVIPKPVRDRFHLRAGSELEVEVGSGEIRLRVPGGEPVLHRKRGLLVHHGPGLAQFDVAGFVRELGGSRAVGRVGSVSGS